MREFLEQFTKENEWMLARDSQFNDDGLKEARRLGLIIEIHGPKGSTYIPTIRLNTKGKFHLRKLTKP